MENTNLLLPTASEESKTENTQQSWVDRKCSYQGLLALFFFMNLLNYLERVVISGSSEKILEFVRKSVPTHENTFFGALTSVFICGFSIASILFGYYVTLFPPFRVVSFGLLCWFCASIASGLAPNYWVLLVARMLSGVGEAAFQIVIPAYINEVSPKEKLGSSMALLYAAISIGTAIGFMLSGWVSKYYSWRLLYLCVAPLMLPAIIILYFVSYEPSKKSEEKMLFVQATWSLLKSPMFICSFLAEAAGVYLCGAYLAFGNQLLLHLGFFTDEAVSSLVYGAICCLAGIVGSVVGGWTLNRMGVDESFSQTHCLYCYSKHFLICGIFCTVFFSFTVFSVRHHLVFFVAFFFGFTSLFASNPSWTLIVLNSAAPFVRPMALGVATVFYHIFGDVPAPVIVGRFLDLCLHRAGSNPHKQWMSYLYTHWFILLSVIALLFMALCIFGLVRKDYVKE